MIELTVLLPCLNEAECIAFCIEEAARFIEKSGVTAEILVADNGSTDGSRQIAEKMGARVITVEQKGYGNALIGGIAAAQGKYIIMADSDASYDLEHLKPFLDKLRSGCCLVMGNRFSGGIEKGAMPFLHRLGVPALSFLARLKYKTKTGDFHCGLRGFDRETALGLGLSCTGMEFATEMIGKFARAGVRIYEIPTVLRRDRRTGKPKLRTFRDGFRHLQFILTDKAQKN